MKDLPTSQLSQVISHYPNINWHMLSLAQEYYQNNGYAYCEVPYLIPEDYSNLTKPHRDQSFVLDHGLFTNQPQELLGSAEQGFIYLMYNNSLISEKLMAITPCFRTESYSLTHLPWFMKAELFHLSDSVKDCQEMINTAYSFFAQYCHAKNLSIIQTSNESWDINLNNIEIGSYGLRRLDFGVFIYGTALALPRFDVAKRYE